VEQLLLILVGLLKEFHADLADLADLRGSDLRKFAKSV
jgi:hypothetical protein